MKKILIMISCLLFVGCSNKNLDFKKIEDKLISSNLFSNHEIVDEYIFSNRYTIDISKFDEVLMLSSTKYDDSTMVLIVSPNNKDTKKEMESFINSYNNQWVIMNYFPKQKELVENGLYTSYSNYLIYIVSDNNEEVLKLIKNN